LHGAAAAAAAGAAPPGRCGGRRGRGALPSFSPAGERAGAGGAAIPGGAEHAEGGAVISRIRGTLLLRELDRVEVMTPGGVAYEIWVPRSVFEGLPGAGEEVELRTYQVVREDAVMLFGFLQEAERLVFSRLLTASGVGPRLALSLLSALPAERLVRAIRE